MVFNQRKKKTLPDGGFTLIELLIVIGIIGVLASIGFTFMNKARMKAYDAETIAQLSLARNAAQLYYDANNYSYSGSKGNSNVANNCNAPHSMFIDSASGMYMYASDASYPAGTDLRCTASDEAYEISASLSTPGEFWCVNYQGLSKKISSPSGTLTHIQAHPNGDTDCTP